MKDKDEIIEEQKKRIKELEESLQKKDKELIKVKDEFDNTKKEFEEFKAKHKTTVANLRKAMKIKADSKKHRKKAGAKLGHKGYARHIPERFDYIKAHDLNKCPHCRTKLGKTVEVRSRYVTDIKLTAKVKTTRHDIHRKYCSKCKKIVEPEVPNVLPHARFGLNLMLFVMYLRLGLRLPCNKVCEFLLTMYNLKISEGEVVHIMKQLSRTYGDYYKYLTKLVKDAKVKHTDSTSWRVNGRSYYAWVFVACGVVLYKIRKRNNHKVPLSVFGSNQKGNVLVIDRFSACKTVAEKAKFTVQFCWSHILQDSKELARDYGNDGKFVHKHLKELYAKTASFHGKGTQEIVEQLKGELLELVEKRYTSTRVRRFLNQLWKDKDRLFIFITHPGVDSTNNISERELRALVIIRKISNGSRSRNGANNTALLLSVIQTLRLGGQNVLCGLKEIINNPKIASGC